MRSKLSNLALLLVSTALGLASLEFMLRWIDQVPLTHFPNFVKQRVDLLAVHTVAQYDALLGWTVAPNLQAGTRGQSFTTDKYGTRMPSMQIRSIPKGGILAVGDSFTNGSEVSDEQSWPAILEAMVGIPVINASAGAWGADQIVLSAERMLDVVEPRAVIVSFLWHDIERAEFSIYAGANKPYYLLRNGRLELRNNPVPRFSGTVREIGYARAILGYSYAVYWTFARLRYTQWINSWDAQYKRAMPRGKGVEISCMLLQRLNDRARATNVSLLFLVQYGGTDFDSIAPPQDASRVINCASAVGILSLDPWTRMKDMFDRNRPGFRSMFMLQSDGRTLGHMSPAGNRFIAEELAAVLRGGGGL